MAVCKNTEDKVVILLSKCVGVVALKGHADFTFVSSAWSGLWFTKNICNASIPAQWIFSLKFHYLHQAS